MDRELLREKIKEAYKHSLSYSENFRETIFLNQIENFILHINKNVLTKEDLPWIKHILKEMLEEAVPNNFMHKPELIKSMVEEYSLTLFNQGEAYGKS